MEQVKNGNKEEGNPQQQEGIGLQTLPRVPGHRVNTEGYYYAVNNREKMEEFRVEEPYHEQNNEPGHKDSYACSPC